MMSRRVRICLFLALAVCLAFESDRADAQIVRRYRGGGVSIRAPFVRVDVGPYGGTSVRAPFVSVGPGGGVALGPRRRILLRQPRVDNQVVPASAVQPQSFGQVQTKPPVLAAAPPLPSRSELRSLDLPELVATLRDLSHGLHEALYKFEDPAGWQQYLSIPEDALGTPGVDEVVLDVEVLQKQSARFEKVATNREFSKIAAIPSFAATGFALDLLLKRYEALGPKLIDPSGDTGFDDPGPTTGNSPAEAESFETLPVPNNPEPRRGERSILKRR